MPTPLDPIEEARRQWVARGLAGADAMTATSSIMRAHQIVLARVDEAVRPFNLNYARLEALALLHFSRTGELPLGKMGQRLMVHPTSVTNAIDRLESQGLVKRVRHPSDRRGVLASITPKGREVAEVALAAVVDCHFGLAELTEPEARRITKTITAFRRRVGDMTPRSDRADAADKRSEDSRRAG